MTNPGIEPGFAPWEGAVLAAWPIGLGVLSTLVVYIKKLKLSSIYKKKIKNFKKYGQKLIFTVKKPYWKARFGSSWERRYRKNYQVYVSRRIKKACNRIRTDDLLITNELRYLLRHTSKCFKSCHKTKMILWQFFILFYTGVLYHWYLTLLPLINRL